MVSGDIVLHISGCPGTRSEAESNLELLVLVTLPSSTGTVGVIRHPWVPQHWGLITLRASRMQGKQFYQLGPDLSGLIAALTWPFPEI